MARQWAIEDLMRLARERSAHARATLLENVTDLFLSEEGRLTEQERALISDILIKLLEEVETVVREQLAHALARSGIELPEVERLLAHDEIAVARPILLKSRALRDPDLIEIIRWRSHEHRLAIAMRDELSEAVSDALVEYGEDDVIEALLRNPDARLSEKAMEYLVAESQRVDRFQEPLVRRHDLPDHLALKMFWWVGAALRHEILKRVKVDPLVLDRAVHSAVEALKATHAPEQSAHAKAFALARRLKERGELTPEFLLACLRSRHLAMFVAGLAELGGIDLRTAWRIFVDRGGEGLAVLARAAGLTRDQFAKLFLLLVELRNGQRAQPPAVLERILELFDKIGEEKARIALFYWRLDRTYEEALEELRDVC
ncbi:MAG: hypothetical protein KatS3mg119_1073 [Rhodothalassiaceae bacterium]|nr:MAG: hypothetical protein KatS3mg119_1073 [Rhodothalassiaceae bacterium]